MAGEIGRVIKKLREAARLRQADLSKACNVKQPNLSRIEKGHCDPRHGTLARIAEALGTTVEAIETEAARRAAAASWAGAGEAAPTVPVPVFDTAGGYGIDFDDTGNPAGSPAMVIHVPVEGAPCFACRVHGESMSQRGEGFEPGSIVVFARVRPANGDFAFVRARSACVFKQVFFEEGAVRLVPVNRAHHEQRVATQDVLDMWKLVLHLRAFR
jgi:transcriptional regulator with XRE-family HTH domain